MSVNPNWARWIFASISYHLKTVATDNNIPAIVEGVDDVTDSFSEATDHAEIRISGPDTQQLSGEYRLLVSVNVLLASRFDGKQKNRHALLTNVGLFHEAMDQAILIYKYGNTLADDDSYLGCLTLRPGKNDSVRVIHFGQIDPTDKVKQSAVDARYEMFLSSE
jgi:hypothetical protein